MTFCQKKHAHRLVGLAVLLLFTPAGQADPPVVPVPPMPWTLAAPPRIDLFGAVLDPDGAWTFWGDVYPAIMVGQTVHLEAGELAVFWSADVVIEEDQYFFLEGADLGDYRGVVYAWTADQWGRRSNVAAVILPP